MALREALEAETARLLVDSRLQSAEVVQLRLLKARTNLAKAYEVDPRDSWLDIEDRLLSIELNAVTQDPPRKPYGNHESTTVHSVSQGLEDKEADASFIDELNMLSSEMQVRNRTEDKLEVNSYQHDELSSDIAEMAKAIKRNAELFQKKLEADSDLVTSTTDAISRTAGSMSNVGSKLSQYRRETQLGWMFYIWSTLFIALSLFFGMAITQLFGKW